MKILSYLIIGIVIILILSKITKGKLIFTKEEKSKKRDYIVKTLLSLGFIIGLVFIFFSTWFVEFFGQITPEQFLFNLKAPLKGTGSGMTGEILKSPVLNIVICAIPFLIFVNLKYNVFLINRNNEKKTLLNKKRVRIISIVLSMVTMIGGVSFGVNKLQLQKVVKAYLSSSTYLADNYVDPRDVKMTFPKKKRNLIHIYLESVENSYLNKELGGYMDVNLMPELTELYKEGLSFSNTDKFGGPHTTYASEWSVAAMINMDTGLPLKIPMGRNSYGKTGSFLPGAVGIGDILEAQGYNQTIMFGADADFGGLTTYFTTHGKFNIFDHKAAKEKGLIPKDYDVWWGYEDDKLYEYAKDEITRLANENKPFNFTMETADTHFPDGYLSEKAEKKHDSQYANVISYSTKEAVDFVKWIQKQPFYKDTTVVITGDHPSMDKKFFKNFDPNYERTIINLILNAPITTDNVQNRQYAPFDMFPTILSTLGVEIEGDRLGLGTNLYSNKKTIIEEQGLDTVNSGLGDNSNFFNDEFINDKKNSTFSNDLITYK
ncbi:MULTISPECIES: LTA synthase family protein [Terrisporobacter]|uniref:Sulfatase n=1 Tax=Terrisporobacter othiniensis TaxID=1577792 RepID=A0A0B3VHR8_9FIRM|nr:MULTISPECIES: LTA synthase family protein [Terrisporobacter]KHS56341.1 sulfatase [Terrisporobacter othiniensis]MCC3668597.1 LTA synthase family protein [Terrisporobacter mayombei]MDU6984303.1 LTA synthase family protein [Terrisporobacter othiniensis]MDY3372291.1 LTA synthase family protein [Terrisporobacter othiniensis]